MKVLKKTFYLIPCNLLTSKIDERSDFTQVYTFNTQDNCEETFFWQYEIL